MLIELAWPDVRFVEPQWRAGPGRCGCSRRTGRGMDTGFGFGPGRGTQAVGTGRTESRTGGGGASVAKMTGPTEILRRSWHRVSAARREVHRRRQAMHLTLAEQSRTRVGRPALRWGPFRALEGERAGRLRSTPKTLLMY